ncbi:2-hydroxyacid dehydrogenase [Methanooceanicella nereidis]|uniref:2-hydroxyacid dehydrogenase n=1 Tax=Methanooceanicella nereidis TaxID=2052831 RepID=UPI001E318237
MADPIYLPENYQERLEKLGNVRIYDTPPGSLEELKSRVLDADIAVVSHCAIPEDIFLAAPDLKFITLERTGYDDVDIEAATRAGVAVANAPGYSNEAVSEHVFALLLAYIRRVTEADRWMREGRFDCFRFKGRELQGKTMGIMGTGRIGTRVIELSKCFGMEVLAYDYNPSGERARKMGYKNVSLDELYKYSDFISIHLPLTFDTESLIDDEAFNKMKRNCVIVNTARGRIIDEDALIRALRNRKIAGACLDVFAIEPPRINNPLLKMDNVILTPHSGYNTVEAMEKCTRITIENIEAFLSGKPKNIINPEAIDYSAMKGEA